MFCLCILGTDFYIIIIQISYNIDVVHSTNVFMQNILYKTYIMNSCVEFHKLHNVRHKYFIKNVRQDM